MDLQKITCGTEISLRKNTILRYKLTCQKITLLIRTWANNLTCLIYAEIQIEISQKTAVDWYCFNREVCTFYIFKGDLHIGESCLTVKIYESLFVKKYNWGRMLSEKWVFGGVCLETNEALIVPVTYRTTKVLIPIIYKIIRPESLLFPINWNRTCYCLWT